MPDSLPLTLCTAAPAEDSAEEKAHNRRQWESREAQRRQSQEQQRGSSNARSYAYYSTSSFVR